MWKYYKIGIVKQFEIKNLKNADFRLELMFFNNSKPSAKNFSVFFKREMKNRKKEKRKQVIQAR